MAGRSRTSGGKSKVRSREKALKSRRIKEIASSSNKWCFKEGDGRKTAKIAQTKPSITQKGEFGMTDKTKESLRSQSL